MDKERSGVQNERPSRIRAPFPWATGWTPFRIAALYLLLGLPYIAYSDLLVNTLVSSPELKYWIGSLKGFGFIIVTAGLLHWMLVWRENQIRTAREATEWSEQKLRSLVLALPDAVFRMDRQGRYIGYHSPTDVQLLVAPEHFLGKTADEVLPPARAKRLMAALKELFTTDRPQTYEYTTEAEPGAEKNYEVRLVQSAPDEAVLIVRNISDRRRAEAALRGSEARLRMALTASRMLTWSWEVAAERWTFSEDFAAYYGLDPSIDYSTERNAMLSVHVEERERVSREVWDGARSEAGDFELEFRGSETLDEPRWYVARGHAEKDERGNVVRLYGVTMDVTRRKRAELLGAMQQRILEKITSGEPLGSILDDIIRSLEGLEHGMRGSVQFLNESGTHLVHGSAPNLPEEYNQLVNGIAVGEGMGSCGTAAARRAPVFVSDIQADPLWDPCRDVAERFGLRACWSEPILTHDGTVLGTFAMYFARVKAPDEEQRRELAVAAHLAGVAIERRRAETMLRDAEEKYRALFTQSPDGVGVIDPVTLEFVEFNDAFVSMLGYRREELSLLRLPDVEAAESAEQSREHIARIVAMGGEDFETLLRRKDGRLINVVVKARLLDVGGQRLLHSITRDVTEAKRNELALRESEARFRMLADSAPVLIWMADATGEATYYNRTWLEYTGRTLEEEIADGWTKNMHPDDRPRVHATYYGALERHEPFRAEYRFRRKDGTYGWLLDQGVPRRNSDGSLAGFIGSCADITDLKRVEAALRTSEATTRALLDAVPDLMFRMDREGKYLAYHAQSTRDLITQPEDFMGRHCTEVLPSWLADLTMKSLGRLFATGEQQRFEYEVARDGRSRFWEVRMVRCGEDEALLLVRDVSEQRLAERSMRDSQHRLELLVSQAPVGVIAWTTDGRIQEWNPEAEQIFGYPAAEVIGKRASILAPSEKRPRLEKAHEQLLSQNGGERVTLDNVTKDGRTVQCEWYNARLLGPGGKAVGIVSVVQDVSGRMQAERRQSMMMAELDHRVKNNLAAVVGLAEQTLRSADSMQDFRETFLGRLRAMARMHSVLAHGKWEGAPLAQLLRQTLEAYLIQGSSGGGPRIVLSGPDLTIPARAASPVAMALHELATNAVKYGALSSASGRVSVTWSAGRTDEGEPCVILEWKESGGPTVAAPSRRGFGTELIQGGIAYELHGTVDLDFHPEGVFCRMKVPLSAEEFPAGSPQAWRPAHVPG